MLQPETDDLAGNIQTAIRNARQTLLDAHRTWMVQPHLVDQVRGIVEQEGVSHLVEVVGNSATPDNTVLVMRTHMNLANNQPFRTY